MFLGLGGNTLALDGHEAQPPKFQGQPAKDEFLQSKARRPFALVSTEATATILQWDKEAVRAASRDQRRSSIQDFPLRHDLRVDLQVKPFSVTGPDTRFVLGRKGQPDRAIEFDPSCVSLFRGKVAGRAGSHVFLALCDGQCTGYVDLGPGAARYQISSRDSQGQTLESGRISVFEPTGSVSLAPDVPFCGVEDHHVLNDHPPESVGASVARGSGFTPGLKHIELAVETDFEYFSLFNDLDAASAYLVELYAAVSDIYIRDVDTRIEVVFARLWDNPNDIVNGPDPLQEFQSYWNANMGAVPRDIAQLFSGRRDYPIGGLAFVSALCNSFGGYSVVGYANGSFPDPSMPSPLSYDLSVTAHEIGHNAGTRHTNHPSNNVDTCDDPLTSPQRGTIMSLCAQTWSGQGANRDRYFHTAVVQSMKSHINSVACVIDDCNMNGIADAADVSSGSPDVNGNNIPDECEDCDGDGTLDDAEIAGGSLDLNTNGIPDECEPDCNGNNVPDDRDIALGTSTDLYGNRIPDECEADCNNNGMSDYSEIQLDITLDVDRNAVLDSCQDCDNDLTTDHEALAGSHSLWIASGLTNSPVREFFANTGVQTKTSGGGAGALAQRGQDLVIAPDLHVLVTSADDDRIMEFDLDGNYLGDFVAPGVGGLDEPAGLTFGPDGNLYVSSSLTDNVLRYNGATGAFINIFASGGGLTAPFGLTFGPNGNLFVTAGDHEVFEYNGLSGAFVQVFVTDANNGGLDQPRGLAFKPDGNLLVCSFGTNETLEFDGGTGDPLGKWAQVGTADVLTQISPWGIRVGPNGNVFIVKTGEDFGSIPHDHGEEHVAHKGDIEALHLTNAQIYEFDVMTGNFIRTHIGGNDHDLMFPTGFDFVPGWEIDCNLNLLPDRCDIASGFSQDADSNNVPDECEIDCNNNGVQDRLDIVPYAAGLDCNGNLSPDSCDIADAISLDCNANAVPDECEQQVDCNLNGVHDGCDVNALDPDGDGQVSQDCNGNLVPDECEVSVSFSDTSPLLSPIGDGSPQSHTVFSPPEPAGNVTLTIEAVADVDQANEFIDVDINGTFVKREFVNASLCPATPDIAQIVLSAPIFNLLVAGGDATINLLPSTQVGPTTCNPSTIAVTLEYAVNSDCNNNGVPDDCDLLRISTPDCNGNSAPDDCDYPDCLMDPAILAGDFTCDSGVDLQDMPGFIDALILGTNLCQADINADMVVDGHDIPDFVTCLTSGCP
ncbi:MAG: M12 family metallo-peptidase [Phycisphaerales bacterium]|nr:M12 family metallo-peptidase [Phycisphaerales bacterium]